MGIFNRKSKIKDLEKKIQNLDEKNRLNERRLYEATRENRPLAFGGAPNTRNHWQAKPLRDQARHLYENDPTARRVIDSIVCNMVGKGIVPVSRSESDLFKRTVDSYLHRWMEFTDLDYDQDNNLPGIQALVVKALVRDGAVFVRRVVKRRKLMLQILEHDYLDTQKNGENKKNGNEIFNGLEYDRRTQRVVAYWLWPYHPDDSFGAPGRGNQSTQFEISNPASLSLSPLGFESVRILSSEICHVKRIERPGQQDGVSWLSPALIKLWDLREYEEAKLKQQKLQASFTAFVQDNYSLSEEERADLIGIDPESLDKMSGRTISPGHIEDLPPGKTITFPSPTANSDERFVERCLRSIAAALGVSYEIFNDYSQVSYSSGRMGFLEMDRYLKHIVKTVIEPQFLTRISEWVLIHLEMNEMLPPNHDIEISWTSPGREMIDPQAEGGALASMVGANLISMRQAHAVLGQDFDRTIQDIQKSNDKMKKVGLGPMVLFGGSAATESAIEGNQNRRGNENGNEEETPEPSEEETPRETSD